MGKLLSKITEIFPGNTEYMGVALVIIGVAVFVTLVLNFVARKLKFVKYLPGIVLIFVGLVSIFSVIDNLCDPVSLNNIFIFITCVAAGLVSILFALIIGIVSN